MTPGVKFHTNWVEVDMRIATAEDLTTVREYVSGFPGCGAEAWPDEQVMAICDRTPGNTYCKRGQHGFHHALETHVPIDESFRRSLQQDSEANE